MESTEQSPDQPTPDENDGENAPDAGLGEVPQPATLPSDEPGGDDAGENDDSESEPDGSDEPEETDE